MFRMRKWLYDMALAVFVRTAVPLLPDTGLENSGLVAHMLVDGRRIRVTLEVMGMERRMHDGL